jgi:dipeptidyl aminopeptidase/acylaminoacyl peptidase
MLCRRLASRVVALLAAGDLFQAALAESGQTRMGEPPWRDLWRYIRNSPVYYADRVQTPLMIIQGDLDYVPMQQGEEFFTALYRQGKEAKFVRYWGEGHVISSPANIRDMWQRIFTWFDGHLKRDKAQEDATAAPKAVH